MVRKLYKHEFKAWLRIMPIVYIILLAVAGMHRLLQIFESDSPYYTIGFVSATVSYALVLYGALFSTTVFSVVRFYKNMFTSEGYLTMTLPVTVSQHLWVKVSTGVFFYISTLLVILLSGAILAAGDLLVEIIKAAVYLSKDLFETMDLYLAIYFVFLLLELLVILLISQFSSFLLLDLCLCIGQLFRKARILASIGAYFCYYMINQFLQSAVMMVIYLAASLAAFTALGEMLEKLADTLGDALPHLIMVVIIIFVALVATVYFLACRFILRKKLNLE